MSTDQGPPRTYHNRPRAAHRVDSGARLLIGADGQRWYITECSCGWSSESCGTAVLAEAAAEQHETLVRRRPPA